MDLDPVQVISSGIATFENGSRKWMFFADVFSFFHLFFNGGTPRREVISYGVAIKAGQWRYSQQLLRHLKEAFLGIIWSAKDF